jgi:hypothetical protein
MVREKEESEKISFIFYKNSEKPNIVSSYFNKNNIFNRGEKCIISFCTQNKKLALSLIIKKKNCKKNLNIKLILFQFI